MNRYVIQHCFSFKISNDIYLISIAQVLYIGDFSVAPRDPQHKSENIDHGEGANIVIEDIKLFDKELEAAVKKNVDSNDGVCVYHKGIS